MNAQCNAIPVTCCVDNASPSTTSITQKLLKRVLHWFIERRYQRKDRLALTELSALDDGILKDIGLSRGDIQWAGNLPLSAHATTELEILARRGKRRR